jgi:TolB protein
MMRKILSWVVLLCFAAIAVFSRSLAAEPVPVPQYAIAFASFAPLNSNLFIADADGRNPKPFLSRPDLDYDASFSRDGCWIVFTSERNGSADIYRAHPNGSGLERLTNDPAFDDQGTLSPDGKWLAFVSTRSGAANIWVMNVATKAARNITQDSSGYFRPSWSPDGRWLALTSDRDSQKPKRTFSTLHSVEVYLVHPDGSGLKRITYDEAFVGSPSWSADGQRLVVYEGTIDDVQNITSPSRKRATTQIVTIDLRLDKQDVMTVGVGEKWSPQWLGNERIGYVSGGPMGGVEFTTGAPGERGQYRNPQWSQDGRRMVFNREAEQAWPPVNVWHSRDPHFKLMRTGIFPSYPPSGDRLVCNDSTAGILHNDVLMMNADGSRRSTLFHDAQRSALAPTWSHQGDKVAFAVGGFFQKIKGDAVADIEVVRTDGSGLEVLTDGLGNAGFPSWSPDGQEIVFRTSGKNGSHLSIVNVRTHAVRALTTGSNHDNFPSWSPKGDRIVFSSFRDRDYEIYSIRPDGTDIKRLTYAPGNDAHPSYSPDGNWIAFASARGGFKDESMLHPFNPQPYGGIYVRTDGSDVRMLTENQYENATPSWIPSVLSN